MTNEEFLSNYTFRELTEDVLAGSEHFYSDEVLNHYEKNGFAYLFSSEEMESISTRKDKAVVPQTTRLMYYDLKDSIE